MNTRKPSARTTCATSIDCERAFASPAAAESSRSRSDAALARRLSSACAPFEETSESPAEATVQSVWV